MEKPNRSDYSTLDLVMWRDASTLILTPKFQRRGVWRTPARSFFIDTLIRCMPVPPMYIRTRQNDERTRIVREVIDGQQRISAVLDYVDGKYSLSRTLDASYKGKAFDDLDVREQSAILEYSFNFEVFQSISDAEILEIFQRLNTHSVQLNAQELRNGSYFGLFKQLSYALAHEHLEFWRRHRIVTENGIARMQEVELTSELIIVAMDGFQDKKKSIGQFYNKYDEEFQDIDLYARRFRNTIDAIEESLGDDLRETEFHRVPLFYSLFSAVYHHLYGLPGVGLPSAKSPLDVQKRRMLRSAAVDLSEIIAQAREDGEHDELYPRFVRACLRQTDNIAPRRERFLTLFQKAFPS